MHHSLHIGAFGTLIFLCLSLVSFQSYATSSAAGNPQLTSDNTSNTDEKLAAYYEIYASVDSFQTRIAQATSANGHRPAQIEVVKGVEGDFHQHVSSSELPANSSPVVQMQVANSNLIVLGTPLTEHSLPIQDHTFLFTEYSVRVDKVISAGTTSVSAGQTILVTRGGGSMVVDGVLIKAIEPGFDQVALNNQYIFMLRSIPQTDAFRALGSATFSVENGTVFPLRRRSEGASASKGTDLNSFLTEVDNAAARKRSGRN